jgi:adenylate cyclase class IV
LPDELEVKTVVTDPARTRTRLRAAGAQETFRGMMRDRRYDQDGRLTDRDEVLRMRTFEPAGGAPIVVIGWKGRVQRSREGYKLRQEIEYSTLEGDRAAQFLEALGYRVVQVIDRYVEVFSVRGASARLEWYPRMDVLLEIEGPPAGIESAIAATGIPRQEFLADALAAFVERYEARSRESAVLAEADLHGAPPSWQRS